MAISKIILNGVTQMDVTDTTATADKILTSYGAYGADGLWMDGTASGGGGGLVYESGTFEPTVEIDTPTNNFSNTHDTAPMFVMFLDQTGDYDGTTYTMQSWVFMNFSALGYPLYASSTQTYYADVRSRYRSTSATSMSSGNSTESSNNFTNVNAVSFSPHYGSGTYYWRAGRTYKWIAVWAPT